MNRLQTEPVHDGVKVTVTGGLAIVCVTVPCPPPGNPCPGTLLTALTLATGVVRLNWAQNPLRTLVAEAIS